MSERCRAGCFSLLVDQAMATTEFLSWFVSETDVTDIEFDEDYSRLEQKRFRCKMTARVQQERRDLGDVGNPRTVHLFFLLEHESSSQAD